MAADPNTSTLAAQLAILSVGQWPVWTDVPDPLTVPKVAADGVALNGAVTALIRANVYSGPYHKAYVYSTSWATGQSWTVGVGGTEDVTYSTTGDADASASYLDLAAAINADSGLNVIVTATAVNDSDVASAPYTGVRLDWIVDTDQSLEVSSSGGALVGLVEAVSFTGLAFRSIAYGQSVYDQPSNDSWTVTAGNSITERVNVAGLTYAHLLISGVTAMTNTAGSNAAIRISLEADRFDTRPKVQIGPCAESAS